MGGSFGGRNPVEKTRGRWKGSVWRGAVGLFEVWNWKPAVRKREGSKKVT
jgi:hypothetical protein